MVQHLLMVVAVLFIPLQPVFGDDLADLHAVFNQDVRLFNRQNPTAFSATAHNDVVLFGILSPFAIKGKEAVRQVVTEYLADHERVSFTPINPEFVVKGSDALAWGHYSISEIPKVGPRVTIHGRYTFAYTKIDGRWTLVALHFSPLQG